MVLKYYSNGSPMWTCLECGKHIDYEIEGSFESCREHRVSVTTMQEENEKKDRELEFEEFNRIMEDDMIACPYCFELHEGWWDRTHVLKNAGDCDANFKCDFCGKSFKVSLAITHTFTSEKKGEGQDGR